MFRRKQKSRKLLSLETFLTYDFRENGGGTGIRTQGGRKPSPVFKTGAFNHSTIPP